MAVIPHVSDDDLAKIDKVLELIQRMPEDELDSILSEYKVIDTLRGEDSTNSNVFSQLYYELVMANTEIISNRADIQDLERDFVSILRFLKHHNPMQYEIEQIATRRGAFS